MSQTVRGRWCGRVVCAGVARMRMMLCDFGGPHTENETLPVQGVRASVLLHGREGNRDINPTLCGVCADEYLTLDWVERRVASGQD